MKLVLILGEKLVHIFSMNAKQQERPEEEKCIFRERLKYKISEVDENKTLLIGEDINTLVGCVKHFF